MKQIVKETGVKNTWSLIKQNGKNLGHGEKEEMWELLTLKVSSQMICSSIAFCFLFFLCRIMLNIIKKYSLLDMKMKGEKNNNGIRQYNDDFNLELDMQNQYTDFCLHYFLNDGIKKLVEGVSNQVTKDLKVKNFSPYQNINLNDNEKLINYLFTQQRENINRISSIVLPSEQDIKSLNSIKLILLMNETINLFERQDFQILFQRSLSLVIDMILTNCNFWFSLHSKKGSTENDKPMIANLLPSYSNISKVILSQQSLPLKNITSIEDIEKFCYNIFDFEVK